MNLCCNTLYNKQPPQISTISNSKPTPLPVGLQVSTAAALLAEFRAILRLSVLRARKKKQQKLEHVLLVVKGRSTEPTPQRHISAQMPFHIYSHFTGRTGHMAKPTNGVRSPLLLWGRGKGKWNICSTVMSQLEIIFNFSVGIISHELPVFRKK